MILIIPILKKIGLFSLIFAGECIYVYIPK